MDSNISVFMKTEDGKQRTIKIGENATLKQLKEKAQFTQMMEIKTLTFKGKVLKAEQEGKTLSELNIKHKSIIHIIAKLHGGI